MPMSQTRSAGIQPLPERRPEDISADALRDEELMRQVNESLEAERRGRPAIPFREVQEKANQRRSA